jgi:branched-chain amino acid transport system substrate-binding protein
MEMKQWLKSAASVAAVLALASGAQACGSGEDSSGGGASNASGGEASELKIGVLLPLSGPSASLGKFAQDGATAAAEYVNSHGGIKSMGGAKIKLVFADHHLDTDAGRAAAQQLIDQDKVNLIIGSSYSDMSLVLAQVCAIRTLPCVSTDAAPDIVKRGGGWMFRPLPSMPNYANSLLDAYKDFGAPAGARIASVVSQGDLGDAVKAAADSGAKQRGWNSVGAVEYAPTTKNFLPIAQQLKGKNPDAVVALSYGEAPQLIKAFDEAGLKTTVLGVSSGWASTPLITTLKDDANGLFASATFDADMIDSSPDLQAMSDAYQQKTGNAPDAQFWIFVGATIYAAQGFEGAGSSDGPKIKDALAGVNMKFADPIQPILNGIQMKDGENSAVTPPVLQIQDRKQVTVWPKDVARGQVDMSGVH